jgi:hypothetical protein
MRASVFLLHCGSRDIARMPRTIVYARVIARGTRALFRLAKRTKLRSKMSRRLSLQRDKRERRRQQASSSQKAN